MMLWEGKVIVSRETTLEEKLYGKKNNRLH